MASVNGVSIDASTAIYCRSENAT